MIFTFILNEMMQETTFSTTSTSNYQEFEKVIYDEKIYKKLYFYYVLKYIRHFRKCFFLFVYLPAFINYQSTFITILGNFPIRKKSKYLYQPYSLN